jgi:hypothetical protein
MNKFFIVTVGVYFGRQGTFKQKNTRISKSDLSSFIAIQALAAVYLADICDIFLELLQQH